MTPLQPSTREDIDAILLVYDRGIQFQKTVFHRHWLGFDRDLLVREIDEGRHWKIMEGPSIACVLSVQPVITRWARAYGATHGQRFIRLDTFPDNDKLMNYYIRCGFRFCGFRRFTPEEAVPEHYRDGLSLFEIALDQRF